MGSGDLWDLWDLGIWGSGNLKIWVPGDLEGPGELGPVEFDAKQLISISSW